MKWVKHFASIPVLLFAIGLSIYADNGPVGTDSAINICKTNDSLVLEVNETATAKLSDVLSDGQLNWIGQYSELSSWVGSIGCFTVDISGYRTISVTENEATRCLFYCNTSFIGLQLEKCMCFGEEIHTNGPANSCRVCNSTSLQACGSETGVSVYRKLIAKPPVPDNYDEHCGTVNCTAGKCLFYQDLCSKRYQGICGKNSFTLESTWNESVYMCRKNSSSLIYTKDFSTFPLRPGTRYWVNIFRNDIPILEKAFRNSDNEYKCLAKKLVKGVQNLVVLPLHNNSNTCLPIICKKAKDWTTPRSNFPDETMVTRYATYSHVEVSTPRTNASDERPVPSDDNKPGLIIAVVTVCVVVVLGILLIVAVLVKRKRKKGVLRKKSTRIAIVLPTIARNTNCNDGVGYEDAISTDSCHNNSSIDIKEEEFSSSGKRFDSRVELVETSNQRSTLTYYEMNPPRTSESSECVDFTYNVPIYQPDEYVAMRNSDNNDGDLVEAVKGQTQKDNTTQLESVRTDENKKACVSESIDGIQHGTGNDTNENDFEPDYYPEVYNFSEAQNTDQESRLESHYNRPRSIDRDTYEDVNIRNQLNLDNDDKDKPSYYDNQLYDTPNLYKVGKDSFIIKGEGHQREEGNNIEENSQNTESLYDYPRPQSNRNDINMEQKLNKNDSFLNSYDMVDNNPKFDSEEEEAVYEPISVVSK